MPIILHDQTKMRCLFHFAELLSFVDAPLAGSKAACTATLANILLKAHVLNVSDKVSLWDASGGKTSSPTFDRHRQRCNRHGVVICIQSLCNCIYDNKYKILAAIHYCVSLQSAISHRLLVRHKKRAKITKIHPFDL